MLIEKILALPGFLYQIGEKYYYLGKWICKECTDEAANDCVMMYEMCKKAGEEKEAEMYFQKIRAYSDFALDIPYNPELIKKNLTSLLSGLSDSETEALNKQVENVA